MAGPGVDLVQVVIDRQALSPNEDVAIITMHCRGVAAGLPDVLNPMDNTNRANFAGKLDTWWDGVSSRIHTSHHVREYRFYALGASAAELLGAPDLIVPSTKAGTSSSQPLPPQVALSVTFKTDQRRQWGRFYVPGLVISQLDTGRWTNTVADTFAANTQTLTKRNATGACLTVWSRVGWTHHDPQTIQVDNIADVIRSRRFSTPTYRSTAGAG